MTEESYESDSTYRVKCAICGDGIPATDTVSLPWGSEEFCSTDCKKRWLNKMSQHVGGG